MSIQFAEKLFYLNIPSESRSSWIALKFSNPMVFPLGPERFPKKKKTVEKNDASS